MPSVDQTNTVTNGRVISKQWTGNEKECSRHDLLGDTVPVGL